MSSCRSVIGRFGNVGLRTGNEKTSFTSASRSSSPSSTACITAVTTTVFETEATMKIVSRVTGSRRSTFAQPSTWVHTGRPRRSTVAARPGSLPADMRSRM